MLDKINRPSISLTHLNFTLGPKNKNKQLQQSKPYITVWILSIVLKTEEQPLLWFSFQFNHFCSASYSAYYVRLGVLITSRSALNAALCLRFLRRFVCGRSTADMATSPSQQWGGRRLATMRQFCARNFLRTAPPCFRGEPANRQERDGYCSSILVLLQKQLRKNSRDHFFTNQPDMLSSTLV